MTGKGKVLSNMANENIISYNDLDYNIKKQFKQLFSDTAMQRFGTISVSSEQFHLMYEQVFKVKVRTMIIDFYSRFKKFEPVFSEKDLQDYYTANVAEFAS